MKMANFWTEHGDNPMFNLKRTQRKPVLRDIFIESMRKLATKPLLKSELQELVRIRRKTFLQLLMVLMQAGVIVRSGDGTKGSPYRYVLADHYC